MTNEEYQQVLKLYAEHVAAEWMPEYMVVGGIELKDKEIAWEGRIRTDLPPRITVPALLGYLLEWLAEREFVVLPCTSPRGKWFWNWESDSEEATRYRLKEICRTFEPLPTIHHAALAAYKHIQESGK